MHQKIQVLINILFHFMQIYNLKINATKIIFLTFPLFLFIFPARLLMLPKIFQSNLLKQSFCMKLLLQ